LSGALGRILFVKGAIQVLWYCIIVLFIIFFYTKSGYFGKNMHIERLCTLHSGQYCYIKLEIELLCFE